MAQPIITVIGIVATQPAVQTTNRGTPYAAFRLAQTERRFNARANRWEDGDTSWYSVTCWRSFGENVAQSLQVGQPVAVTGRLKVREFTTDEGKSRQQAELHAITIGHDLKRGISNFTKVSRPAAEFVDEDAEVSEFHNRLAERHSNTPWSEPTGEPEESSPFGPTTSDEQADIDKRAA